MITLSSRRIWLATIPTALILGTPTLFAQGARGGEPAGVIRAMPTSAPADRIHLNTDQVRLLLAAHHPAIVDGLSDDNTVTIILASNGSYLASSATKATMPTAVARAGGEGGVIVAAAAGARSGGDGSGAVARGGGGASGGGGGARAAGGAVGGFARGSSDGASAASASPTPAGEVRRVGQMTFPGIGTIDADVVHDTFWTNYEAGELVAGAMRVRFVVLVPNAVIK